MRKLREMQERIAEEFSGIVIKHNGKKYITEKELGRYPCKKCALYKEECPRKIIQYCLKGVILKEIDE